VFYTQPIFLTVLDIGPETEEGTKQSP